MANKCVMCRIEEILKTGWDSNICSMDSYLERMTYLKEMRNNLLLASADSNISADEYAKLENEYLTELEKM